MSANSAIYNPSQTTSAATGEGFSVPRLTTTGRLAITFTATDNGMMVYDTTLNNLFIWTGAAWESVPASGDAGANGAVQYNDNGVVSGAANFFWDKTNNRVGILTASPTAPLDILGNGLADALLIRGNDNANCKIRMANSGASGEEFSLSVGYPGASNSSFVIRSITAGINRYVADQTGAHFWATNAGTAMTLNSTGLGVGVTPSAWAAGVKGFEIGSLGSGITSGSTFSGTLYSTCNAYNDGSWKYARNAAASLYGMNSDKSFAWYQNSNSPSVGGAITWTQAMTLDAIGNLLVGTTSALNSVAGSYQVAIGGSGIQTLSQAISAATATTICRSGSGGMAVVAGYNGTGQYSAIIIFSYGAGGGVTVVSSQNNTGSTITYALSGVNVQVTSSLALTNLTTTCIRTA